MRRSLRYVVVWGVAVALIFALQGVSQAQKSVIRVQGPATMAGLVDSWGKSFMRSTPGVSVIVAGGPSECGLDAILGNEAEIAMCSRSISQEEKDDAEKKGIRLQERQVSRTGLCFFVNPKNPVNELTIKQVGEVFTWNISDWSELGGPQMPIKAIALTYARHGTGDWFSNDVLKGVAIAPIVKLTLDLRSLFGLVTKDPGAIGFGQYWTVLRVPLLTRGGEIKILKIKRNPESLGVLPSPATMKSGEYPLVRPLYFCWNANRASGILINFVNYCVRKGM